MENLPAERNEKPLMKMAPGGGLLPDNFEGMWRMANIMADSGMMPKGVNRPESVFVAVQMGLEVGLAPMQAVQNIAVINGRPSIWGDSVLGLVRASGKLKSFSESFKGTFPEDDFAAVVVAERDNERIEREFSVADAKAAGLWTKEGPWKQYPKRMLQMRARSWALRDGFGDILKGLRTAEEAMDYDIDLRQNKSGTYGVDADPPNDEIDRLLADRKPTEDDYRATNQQTAPPEEKPGSQPDQQNQDKNTTTFQQMGGKARQSDPPWDPRKEPVMKRYVAEKAATVTAMAEKMGIATDGRMPADIHADILDAGKKPSGNSEPETPPEEKTEPTGQMSTREQFLQALAERGVADEELPKVNDYVDYCVKTSAGGSARDVYLRALEDIKAFIEYFRGYIPPEKQTDDQQKKNIEPSERAKLLAQVLELKQNDESGYDKARSAAGIHPFNPHGMSEEQLRAVVENYNGTQGGDRDPFAGGF